MSNKNLVLTGATKGIGLSTARLFASQGFNMAICARTENDLDSLKNELENDYGVSVICKAIDLNDLDSVHTFIAHVTKQYNHIDILINNAGWFIPENLLSEPDDNLHKMLSINLIAPYYLCKYLTPLLKNSDKGHIFNIGSITTKANIANVGSYGISKYALKGLTTVLREELKTSNIKVTDVIPGATWTNSWKGVDIDPNRLIDPDDIAASMLSAYQQSPRSVVEEIIIRPMKGDI